MSYEPTGDQYRPGGTWGICDRCGFKYRLTELRREWTGLRVCNDDFDPRPAELTPPRFRAEGLSVSGARPDPDAATISEVNTTTRDDL